MPQERQKKSELANLNPIGQLILQYSASLVFSIQKGILRAGSNEPKWLWADFPRLHNLRFAEAP